MRAKHQTLLLSLAALLLADLTLASPFYYYFQDASPPAPDNGAAELANQGGQQEVVANKMQQVAGQAQEALAGDGSQDQLPKRIHGHLSELYSHGSSAMKNVVDTVQPDFKNIGKDLNDVYQATRTQVGKKIEPLAQTVRPYIDHAQKVVAPYVTQAKEEVPKLINQAGPALSKVSEQMRDTISGVLGKLKPNGAGGQQMAMGHDSASSLQQGSQNHLASTNNIHDQFADESQIGAKASNMVSQTLQQVGAQS